MEIKKDAWSSINNKKSTELPSEPVAAAPSTGGGFFLSFDQTDDQKKTAERAEKAAIEIKEKIENETEEQKQLREEKAAAKKLKAEEKLAAKILKNKEKRNKKLERDKAKLAEVSGEGVKVAFEDLPSRIQKRIEKRNRKKKEERAAKKTSKSL
jgi:uncharacterized protein YlxW (UPF0749 family)